MPPRRVRQYEIEIDRDLIHELEQAKVVVTRAELSKLVEFSLRKALLAAQTGERLVLTPDEVRAQQETR
jgi:hypothetical protein